MGKPIRTVDGTWRVQFRTAAVKVDESFSAYAEAKTFELATRKRIAAAKSGEVTAPPKHSTLADLIDVYIKEATKEPPATKKKPASPTITFGRSKLAILRF